MLSSIHNWNEKKTKTKTAKTISNINDFFHESAAMSRNQNDFSMEFSYPVVNWSTIYYRWAAFPNSISVRWIQKFSFR